MHLVDVIENAAVIIQNGRIAWFGPASEQPEINEEFIEIDAEGCCVIPGLIDCHTHTVFAGTREHEYTQRAQGKSYTEIAKAGGGIRTTMKSVREATKTQLIDLARPRLLDMLCSGITTIEVKSGYGLTPHDEVKMLEAIAELDAELPMELIGTYLAAHTIPPEHDGNASGYLDTILNDKLLFKISSVGLAEFCDVFCETTAFDVEQSRRVLTTARNHGMLPKVHADQITQMGASKLAADVGAISADHLECIDDAGIAAMLKAGTIAVLLPGCSFFLGVEQADARRMMNAGLPVAIATDYNPGSSMINSLPLVMSIACSQMKMTPWEVLVGATANAAAALNRHTRIGAIAVGMEGDLAILGTPNWERFCYEVPRYPVLRVLKRGTLVVDTETDEPDEPEEL
jgi:imidazolonepropionase